MTTRRVRTTIRPDQELEVDDAEFTDLQRQGLLLPGVYAEQFDIAEGVAGGMDDSAASRTASAKGRTSKTTVKEA